MEKLTREVALLKRGTRQDHTIKPVPDVLPFYVQGPKGQSASPEVKYFLVPVTASIPPQVRGAVSPYDGRRHSRKVVLSGFRLKLELQHYLPVKIAIVMYKHKVGPLQAMLESSDGVSRNFNFGVKEGNVSRLLTLQETGFCQGRDGPFAVVHDGDFGSGVPQWSLESTDGSMYGAEVRPEMVVGKLHYVVGDKGTAAVQEQKGVKMMSTMVETRGSGGLGVTSDVQAVQAGTVTPVRCYWDLGGAKLEFDLEESGQLTTQEHLQVVVMVSSAGGGFAQPKEANGDMPSILCGVVKSLAAKVYFHS